jgi:hypothetical protein
MVRLAAPVSPELVKKEALVHAAEMAYMEGRYMDTIEFLEEAKEYCGKNGEEPMLVKSGLAHLHLALKEDFSIDHLSYCLNDLLCAVFISPEPKKELMDMVDSVRMKLQRVMRTRRRGNKDDRLLAQVMLKHSGIALRAQKKGRRYDGRHRFEARALCAAAGDIMLPFEMGYKR